ncbi:TPM domain-containing protein [Ramlibacter albus]|uniref:TPM domain-containing protein n=1 Tax=Ramlibacter albus TaxID=2079448 RepID=A0A923MEB4_9BURK|nr:TPM domain-containing protein [Ramlibacter albus]MBC5768541.1 TPM domain-containing protein [Ramlibacter albus]
MAPGAAAAVDVPPFTALLVDETATLSEPDGQNLLARLQGIQSSGRAQVAVLVAKDARGLPLSDFSLRVAETWKVGRAKKDDGLLVVVVPSQNAARLEVGYGLEGSIPDAVASQWIAELLPAMKRRELAEGLGDLLSRVEGALPVPQNTAKRSTENILDQHPEWGLPFALVIFSPFALFPLFFGRWGALASAPLFAGMVGGAAWTFWESQLPTATAAGIAFVLPIAWSLNHNRRASDPAWLRWFRDAGNLAAVLIMFSILSVFIGVALSGQREATWTATLFAGAMSLGLFVFLFPGRPAYYAMLVLRSYMHFAFLLAIAYLALVPIHPDPTRIAFGIAGGLTSLIVLALWCDAHEAKRASLWIVALVLLAMLPLGALLMLQAALGEDFDTQVLQLAAGGGSIGAVLLWAARQGFFAALSLGLGGRFGGGGAEGRD